MEDKAKEFLEKYGWPEDKRNLIAEILVDFANSVNKISDKEIREAAYEYGLAGHKQHVWNAAAKWMRNKLTNEQE